RLSFGRSPIDFIGQKKGGKDGAFYERELIALKIENIGPGDVSRHKVRGELDAGEFAAENVGKGANEESFCDTGDSFDQSVVAGENGDERFLDDIVLADDHLGSFVPGLREDVF